MLDTTKITVYKLSQEQMDKEYREYLQTLSLYERFRVWLDSTSWTKIKHLVYRLEIEYDILSKGLRKRGL